MSKRKPKVLTPEQVEEIRTKDFFDCILPSTIKFFGDHYIVGDSYRCVWAIREYPPSTEEQAILSQLADRNGVTLRIYHRLVESMEQRKIIQNATRRNTLKSGGSDMNDTIEAEGNLTYPNGEQVKVSTWREVASELLRDCNSDPARHEALINLRYKVGGNSRWFLTDTDRKLDVPIKIDEDLYFEGKFDTEYLLKMMTEKIFEKVGYPYEMIEIEVRSKGQIIAPVDEPEETVAMQIL